MKASALLLVGLTATGCAMPEHYPIPSVNEVVVASEQGGKFLSFIGPRRQFAEPFLGVPNTNFFLLRSFVDTRSHQTAHQLFVEESYVGKEREWNAAHDGRGAELPVVAITKSEITCQATCSYAEEFAAVLPDALLRTGGRGLTVSFIAKSGERKDIAVPGELVQKQLAAVDGTLAARPATPTPPK